MIKIILRFLILFMMIMMVMEGGCVWGGVENRGCLREVVAKRDSTQSLVTGQRPPHSPLPLFYTLASHSTHFCIKCGPINCAPSALYTYTAERFPSALEMSLRLSPLDIPPLGSVRIQYVAPLVNTICNIWHKCKSDKK